MAEEKELELDAKEIDADIDEIGNEAKKKAPSKAEQKVELDLDDAPFLEEEEEEKEEEKAEPETKEDQEDEAKEEQETEDSKSKRKKIILLGTAIGILVVAGLIVFLFLKGEKKESPKEPPKEEKKVPEKKVEVKEKPPPPKPKMIQLTLRPFWVDYPVENGHRYLHIVLILSYEESRLNWELLRKRIVIRDALYYYLKNKKIDFFLKKENIPVLKKDILSIINQYLVYGRIKKIYLKDYLVE